MVVINAEKRHILVKRDEIVTPTNLQNDVLRYLFYSITDFLLHSLGFKRFFMEGKL